MSKCLSKDRNNNPCRSHSQDDTQFCKNHQYMVGYTVEMLSALQLCKGCKKMYYFEGDVKQCVNCLDRGKENRVKAKENVVLCKSDGCKFKRSVENIYCGLHHLCLFVDECTARAAEQNLVPIILSRVAKSVCRRSENGIKRSAQVFQAKWLME